MTWKWSEKNGNCLSYADCRFEKSCFKLCFNYLFIIFIICNCSQYENNKKFLPLVHKCFNLMLNTSNDSYLYIREVRNLILLYNLTISGDFQSVGMIRRRARNFMKKNFGTDMKPLAFYSRGFKEVSRRMKKCSIFWKF